MRRFARASRVPSVGLIVEVSYNKASRLAPGHERRYDLAL